MEGDKLITAYTDSYILTNSNLRLMQSIFPNKHLKHLTKRPRRELKIVRVCIVESQLQKKIKNS